MKRQQKGYIFRKGKSWFLRYLDDVLQPDNTIKRKPVCKKLDVEYSDQYRTKASVKAFAQDILAPINSGLIDAKSTMFVTDFVMTIYFPEYANKKRASTSKSYRDMFNIHLKHRLGKLTLRQFRTVDGERLLAAIARDTKLGRNSLKHIKSFLSGVFKQAKRLGVLNGVNPMADTSIPPSKEPAETHAYSLDEIKRMLARLAEPARTVIMTAALTGLRKGEIAGLC